MTTLPSRESVVHDFRLAAERDDASALAALLHPDAVALTDGGGDVIAPTIPVRGRSAVIAETRAMLSRMPGRLITEQRVNATPALVVRWSSRVVAILNFGITDGLVTHLWITRSPQKLARWNSEA